MFDELDRITYSFNLEEIIKRIKEVGFVDINSLWHLDHIGVKLARYLIKYKNISEDELQHEYVTYQNFIDIMNYTIDNWVEK